MVDDNCRKWEKVPFTLHLICWWVLDPSYAAESIAVITSRVTGLGTCHCVS